MVEVLALAAPRGIECGVCLDRRRPLIAAKPSFRPPEAILVHDDLRRGTMYTRAVVAGHMADREHIGIKAANCIRCVLIP